MSSPLKTFKRHSMWHWIFFAYCLHDMHQSRNWQNHKILSMHKKKELLPSTLMSKKCLSVTLFCLRGYKNNFATFFFSRECFHHWYDVPENHETESGVCVSNWWNFIYVGLVSSNTKDNQWKQVKSFKVYIIYHLLPYQNSNRYITLILLRRTKTFISK